MAKNDLDPRAYIEASNPTTLWWALYRLLDAIHAARHNDPSTNGEDKTGGPFNVVYFTANHWDKLIPGLPTFETVSAKCRADDAHHERTYLGERLGVRLTGDEFF